MDWDEVGKAFGEAFHVLHLAGVTGVAAAIGASAQKSAGCTFTDKAGICGRSAEGLGLEAGLLIAAVYVVGVFLYAVLKVLSERS